MNFKNWFEAYKEVDIDGDTVPLLVNPYSEEDIVKLGSQIRGIIISNGSVVLWTSNRGFHLEVANRLGEQPEVAFNLTKAYVLPTKYMLTISQFSNMSGHAEEVVLQNPFMKRLFDQDFIIVSPEAYGRIT